jgi:hypothetical protein
VREWRRLLAVALTAFAVVGCAGMPTGGGVHLGRALPAPGGLDGPDVRVLPPSWKVGLDPVAVVTGYLHAMVNDDDDYAIARSYLTAGASSRWRPSTGVTTYDSVSVKRSGGAASSPVTVVLRTPRIGHVDRRGDYQPTPGTLVASFTVARSGEGWRIDHAPDGVLLRASDMQRSLTPVNVYYLNRAGSTLVPEQIFLPNSQRGVATALVAALLNGPGSWLAPAVRSITPARLNLVGNVPVDAAGVADVNLSSSVRQASANDLALLSAQLVWTLRQVPEVTSVRLLAEGAPLTVPGVPTRQPITTWSGFDPAAPPSSSEVLYVRAGHLVASSGTSAALTRSDPGRALSVARSRNGDTLAVVQQAGTGVRLLTGEFGHPLDVRTSAAAMTAPTFDAGGDVITVASGRAGTRVVAVTPDGSVRRVAVDATFPAGPVSALRLSRDGARVAAIVGSGPLVVGRVVAGQGTLSFSGFRSITSGLTDLRGLSWTDASTLVVTASGVGGRRQIVETDIDGYSSRLIGLDGMRGAPVDVSGAPGQPLFAVTGEGTIWADVEGWRRIGAGVAAVHSG